MPSPTQRQEKLSLRLTREAKRALQAAASATQHSVSEFVLDQKRSIAHAIPNQQSRGSVGMAALERASAVFLAPPLQR